MSYCRYGPNSDVYVIRTFGGELECLGCVMRLYYTTMSELDMIGHLIEHRGVGDLVPEPAMLRLAAEWERREKVLPSVPPRP